MATQSLCVGRGTLRISTADQTSVWKLRYKIFDEGISFFDTANTPLSFFQWMDQAQISRTTSLSGQGHLTLVSLAASPYDAFYGLKLNYSATSASVSLTINHVEAFAEGMDTYFENLNVSFVETEGGSELAIEGQVSINLFGTEVPLKAHLYKSRGLVFKHQNSLNGVDVPQDIEVDSIGRFQIDKLEVGVDEDRWNQLQLLYNFDAGAGKDIYDHSGIGDPLNVVIATENKVSWIDKGIAIGNNSTILSRDFAKKVIKASESSNEVSIEVWLKPTEILQGGPARIVSISSDTGNRLITLGHGPNGGTHAPKAARYNGRIRSTATDDNGLTAGNQSLLTAEGTLRDTPTHVVLTRDADGWERIYINGLEAASQQLKGNLSEWKNKYHLLLGNEKNGDRAWQGELYQLAIYNRALSAEEIHRHYFPQVTLTGTFKIAQAPVPMDIPFEADIALLPNKSTIQIQHEAPLQVRPMLALSQLALSWSKDLSTDWQVSGGLEASFWESPVPMQASLRGEAATSVLSFGTKPDEKQAFNLPNLGTLSFFNLQLDAVDNWKLSSETDMEYAILPAIQHRAFDLNSDLMLIGPSMSMDDIDIILLGSWLKEVWRFYAKKENDLFILSASQSFSLPFSLELPSLYDPASGVLISEPISLDQELIYIELVLSLNGDGFLLDIASEFSWADGQAVDQNIELPTFQLYQPPASKHELLGVILDELQLHANDLFADQGKNVADYYIFPRNTSPIISLGNSFSLPSKTEITLPRLFDTNSPIEIQVGIFDLQQEASTQIRITAAGKNQAEIDADYAALWAEISNQGLSFLSGAAQLLQLRIAESLPLAYDSLLSYYYGFQTTAEGNYVDLQAGMRLRVDFQNYQYVRSLRENARSGFVGSGSSYLQLHNYTRRLNDGTLEHLLGFDGFLSQLTTNVGGLLTDGAGGALDLQNTGYRKAYYRLIYPSNFSAENSSINPAQQVSIIGADTYTQLAAATEQFLKSGIVPIGVPVFYFHGKAAVVPEIAVFVREHPVYVSLGTTLRQLLERYSGLSTSAISGQDMHTFLGNSRPLRIVHEGIENRPSYRFINIAETEYATDGTDSLDLALIKGDRFYI